MTVYRSGQTVHMKKRHPCGSFQWEILKPGMYYQIRCKGCGRHVQMHWEAFEKGVKQIIEADPDED